MDGSANIPQAHLTHTSRFLPYINYAFSRYRYVWGCNPEYVISVGRCSDFGGRHFLNNKK